MASPLEELRMDIAECRNSVSRAVDEGYTADDILNCVANELGLDTNIPPMFRNMIAGQLVQAMAHRETISE